MTTKKDQDLITAAMLFAKRKHRAQLDDSGKPFFFHVWQVAKLLMAVSTDAEVIAAGYLHDTLEDTDTTYSELWHTFSKRVADLVNEVTHEGNKKHGYYFPRLKTREGILIKFADRLSNLSRMEPWSDKRRNHYLKRSKFWKSEMTP